MAHCLESTKTGDPHIHPWLCSPLDGVTNNRTVRDKLRVAFDLTRLQGNNSFINPRGIVVCILQKQSTSCRAEKVREKETGKGENDEL